MKKGKRLLALALAAGMVTGMTALAAGVEKTVSVTPMQMTVNGQAVTPTKSDGTPAEVFAYEGATYAPVRYLASLLGIDMDWDQNDPNTAKLINVPGFTAPKAGTTFTPGVYTASADGRNGPVKVEVTLETDKIVSVKVTEHAETAGIADGALSGIPAAIVEGQTLAVDAVSNATMTSQAILAAVEDCVKQAGGNAAALKTVANADAPLVPGIYEGTAKGYTGETTVYVTVSADRIEKVVVASCTDTPVNIQRPAVAQVPQRIVEHQSTRVDGVAGATFTSNAIKAAVAQALGKAGNAARFAVDVARPALTQGTAETVDVLVLGGGGSGCMAALYAQNEDLIGEDTGLKVMVVEKQGYLGGSTMQSGGYIGAAMPLGDDTLLNSDMMDVYLDYSQMEGRPEVDRPLLERVARVSNTAVLNMQKLGLPMMTAASTLPADRYGDLIGWSLLSHTYEDVPPDGWQQAGDELGRWFERRLAQTNVDVRLNTTADELVVENNAVVGAVVHDGEKSYTVRAKKVIVACGGMVSNPEMIAQYYPQASGSPIYANPGNTGDGLRMVGEKFGVEPVIGRLMDGYFGVDGTHGQDVDLRYMFFDASHSIFVVNKGGERIANDGVGYSTHGMCDAIYEQEGKTAYVIVDANHPGVEMIENSKHQDVIVKGNTLAEVAAGLGIDAGKLQETVDAYNAVRSGRGEDPFGVAAADMISLEKGPFYGFPMNVPQTATFSGLLANEDCQLLDRDGKPIQNLYGSGETIYGEAGVAGALFTGAIAGTEAAGSILGK